jgi:TolB-like protein/Tfp pilus assembly protein PilF
MPEDRRLAAIMFTDIVGYTNLMGANEEKAVDLIRRNRKIHQSVIRKHKGKWHKEMGDGTLASFNSAIDAVYCAAEILSKCKEAGICLRVGIHLGDIFEEKGDVFGDGVNLASRLETSAEAGTIYVSEPVYRNVKNKTGVSYKFVEEKIFKNVDEAVKTYSLTVDLSEQITKNSKHRMISRPIIFISALSAVLIILLFGLIDYLKTEKLSFTNTSLNSIAVMPFTDMSPEQNQGYLGDGIAEEIINQLTRVRGLKVIGRTSSFSFRNKDSDLKTIGEILGVKAILEGSVQKSGNKLRVTAQLISTEDGFHIWSERYDREMKDIFEIQDELSQLIVDKIHLGTRPNTQETVTSYQNVDAKAYDLFLMGKHIHQTKFEVSFRMEDFKTAETMFLKSIEIDPNFALPHAGLADIYHSYQMSFAPYDDNPEKRKYQELQKKHINIAYALNPYSDYVNHIKGWVYNSLKNYDSAYYYIKQAIVINPREARNYFGLAVFLFERGLNDESNILFEKAREIDPLDRAALPIKAQIEYESGNDDKALDILKEILSIDLNSYNALFYEVAILLVNGRVDEAQKVYNEMLWRFPDEDNDYLKGAIYAARGDSLRAFKSFNGGPFYYRLLGNKEEFLKTLPDYFNEEDNFNKSFYISMIHSKYFGWVRNEMKFRILIREEEKEYNNLKAKFGNLDFIGE